MEPFTCPQCGHRSSFDPLAGSAVCPQCGYTPPKDRRAAVRRDTSREHPKRAQRPEQVPEVPLSLLDELLSHWDGSHTPEPVLRHPTKNEAIAFFALYERALGEGVHLWPGRRGHYTRGRHPQTKAMLWFVAAYFLLRHGQRSKAAKALRELTERYPDFPDAWVWLSATTDDPQERIDHLENAVIQEPAHPLARDALAIAQGRVSPGKRSRRRQEGPEIRIANCAQCGGALHYEAGAPEVLCQYCGHRVELRESKLIDGEATLLGDLRLRRRLEGHVWREVQRIVHCHACGAELAMTGYLAKQCLFCGSASILVEDSRQDLEQPDGFLPFKLDEQTATAAIDKAQRSTARRLKAWWGGYAEAVTGLKALYLPFWVFDGFVEVRAPAMGQSDARVQHGLPGSATEWARWGGLAGGTFMALRQGDQAPGGGSGLEKELMVFDNLLYPAVDFPPYWLLKQILPFELGAIVPYEPYLLANWPAALYGRDVEVAVKDAYNTMLRQALVRKRSRVLSQITDFDRLRRMFQVTTVTYQLVLLPVWVALAQSEQGRKLVLVNGQTGRVIFSNPLSVKPQNRPDEVATDQAN